MHQAGFVVSYVMKVNLAAAPVVGLFPMVHLRPDTPGILKLITLSIEAALQG